MKELRRVGVWVSARAQALEVWLVAHNGESAELKAWRELPDPKTEIWGFDLPEPVRVDPSRTWKDEVRSAVDVQKEQNKLGIALAAAFVVVMIVLSLS